MHSLPSSVRIPAGWNGPATSANGGAAAAAAAAPLGGLDGRPVAVRLHAPPPMDVPLHVTADGEGLVASAADGTRVLSARPAREDEAVAVPPDVDLATVPVGTPPADHLAPTCLACGGDRDRGLGVHVVELRRDDAGLVVGTRWRPPAWTLGADGTVDPRLVWAALDCPGAFAVMWSEPSQVFAALGGMTGLLRHPVRGDADLVVLGWTLPGAEGRRRPCATAVVEPGRGVLATSVQTCVAVPPGWAA